MAKPKANLENLSAESSGQAEAKYSTYIDSIEAKSSALNTSIKELLNGLVTNEFVGNLTDATTGVIKFADEYRVLQNLLKSVTFYAFAKGLVSTKNSLLGIVTDVKNVSTAFVQLETVQKSTRGTELYKSNIKALGTTVSALSDKQIKLLLSTNQLSNSQKVAILHASGLSKKEAELKLQTLGLATTQKTATAKLTDSINTNANKQWADQHKPEWSASRDDYKINNQSQVINNNNSIGDIVIQNPVGNSDDLAREFANKLTLSLQRQMYTNLKK